MKSERIKGKIKWLFSGTFITIWTEFLSCFCSYSHSDKHTSTWSSQDLKTFGWIFVWACVVSQLLTRCFCVFRYAYSRPVILRGLTDNTVRYWINHWLHVETLTSCRKSHSCVCVVNVLISVYEVKTRPLTHWQVGMIDRSVVGHQIIVIIRTETHFCISRIKKLGFVWKN